MLERLSLAALALTAVTAGLIAADSSSANRIQHPASFLCLYRRSDAALDNGSLTANFAPVSMSMPERHTLLAADPRTTVRQPHPSLAR